MEAIILAGGFGTRLSHIVKDVPKPMASVAGKPFLTYILDYLTREGVTRVVMATGYKHEVISDYFGEKYGDITIEYSIEKEPLGTGGAIKKALAQCLDKEVLIINGDTFFDANVTKMSETMANYNADIVVCGKKMFDFDRYGAIVIENSRITLFDEKKPMSVGVINGGVYLAKRDILDNIASETFSFEKEYLEKDTCNKRIFATISDGYFIDIGIPSDFLRANEEFKQW